MKQTRRRERETFTEKVDNAIMKVLRPVSKKELRKTYVKEVYGDIDKMLLFAEENGIRVPEETVLDEWEDCFQAVRDIDEQIKKFSRMLWEDGEAPNVFAALGKEYLKENEKAEIKKIISELEEERKLYVEGFESYLKTVGGHVWENYRNHGIY